MSSIITNLCFNTKGAYEWIERYCITNEPLPQKVSLDSSFAGPLNRLFANIRTRSASQVLEEISSWTAGKNGTITPIFDEISKYLSDRYTCPTQCTVIPVTYIPKRKFGDFLAMVADPGFLPYLMIYNDNEEAFRSGSLVAGGGNAQARPYKDNSNGKVPRTWGIPTGVDGAGYYSLTKEAKQSIDDAVQQIVAVVKQYKYPFVVFSSKANADGITPDGTLGTSIYAPGEDVKAYFVSALNAAVNGLKIR